MTMSTSTYYHHFILFIWITGCCQCFQHVPNLFSNNKKIISSSLLSPPFQLPVYHATVKGRDNDYSPLENIEDNTNISTRRSFISSSSAILLNTLVATSTCIIYPNQVLGIVTDETSSFANTNYDSSYAPQNLGSLTVSPHVSQNPTISINEPKRATDEIEFTIPLSKLQSSPLGIELADVEFRTNRRVYVKSIKPFSLASDLGIQPNWLLVKINGQTVERTNAQGVKQIISQILLLSSQSKSSSNDNLQLVFRDNSFQDQLQALSSNKEAVTQVAPTGDTTQRNLDGSIRVGKETSQQDQKMVVSQLVPPRMCKRGARVDDLLEISYIGSIVETNEVFDGSAVMINGKGVPGRGNDVSLFFVLGKQPFGQFPPGWDVGLEGICVGERRRVVIPPVLAYGSTGLPRRGIPPDATLQYDITLVSLNGLANPQ